MIEWIINLSANEMWFYGIVSTVIAGLVLALITQRLNHALASRRERHKNIISASTAFRSVFNPEVFEGLNGHQLNNALIRAATIIDSHKIEGEFFKHKRALHEFKVYLGWFDRFRLGSAWKKYHGGNEEYPDLFKMYCIKDHGPKLLKERIEKLRSIGNKR